MKADLHFRFGFSSGVPGQVYLDALCLVLLLLRLEGELDEELLQLLVAVVYTELFETERRAELQQTGLLHHTSMSKAIQELPMCVEVE